MSCPLSSPLRLSALSAPLRLAGMEQGFDCAARLAVVTRYPLHPIPYPL